VLPRDARGFSRAGATVSLFIQVFKARLGCPIGVDTSRIGVETDVSVDTVGPRTVVGVSLLESHNQLMRSKILPSFGACSAIGGVSVVVVSVEETGFAPSVPRNVPANSGDAHDVSRVASVGVGTGDCGVSVMATALSDSDVSTVTHEGFSWIGSTDDSVILENERSPPISKLTPPTSGSAGGMALFVSSGISSVFPISSAISVGASGLSVFSASFSSFLSDSKRSAILLSSFTSIVVVSASCKPSSSSGDIIGVTISFE
jgi:hypothetical protein